VAEIWHGKYVVTQPKQNLVVADWAGNLQADTSTRVMYLDGEVIPGAFYVECVWFWPTLVLAHRQGRQGQPRASHTQL